MKALHVFLGCILFYSIIITAQFFFFSPLNCNEEQTNREWQQQHRYQSLFEDDNGQIKNEQKDDIPEKTNINHQPSLQNSKPHFETNENDINNNGNELAEEREKWQKFFANNAVNGNMELIAALRTIPRSGSEPYLINTLDSIKTQATMAPFNLSAVVVNLRPGKHSVFDQAKSIFASKTAFRKEETQRHIPNGDRFYFVETNSPNNPHSPEETFQGKWDVVTHKDIQLNMDFIAFINSTYNTVCRPNPFAAKHKYVLLMEDDFQWCPFAYQHLFYALTMARKRFGKFSALRVSYGMNGVIVPCSDLKEIMGYIRSQYRQGPADTLLGEFWTKEVSPGEKFYGDDRSYVVYHNNLLDHIGKVSTRSEGFHMPFYPQCYDTMYTYAMWIPERFSLECIHDSFTPCPSSSSSSSSTVDPISLLTTDPNLPSKLPHPQLSLFSDVASTQKKEKSLPFVVLPAKRNGESCDAVCFRSGYMCREALLPMLNNCETLKRHFKCSHCEFSGGLELPSFSSSQDTCYVNPIHMMYSCSGSGWRTRLCPCSTHKR